MFVYETGPIFSLNGIPIIVKLTKARKVNNTALLGYHDDEVAVQTLDTVSTVLFADFFEVMTM